MPEHLFTVTNLMASFARTIAFLFVVAAVVYWFSSSSSTPTTASSYRSTVASDDLNENDTTDDGLTFHGYDCTQDCSGHEAGYAWAEQHDITDPDDCDGKSESFIEGCRAYAEENEAADHEDNSSDDEMGEEP